jgi:hypothetical protein
MGITNVLLDRHTLIDLYFNAYLKAIPGSDMEEAYLVVTSMLMGGHSIDACTEVLHQRTQLAYKKKNLGGYL